MAGPLDFLNRFRPAGTPGPPARAGVPADRVAEADAELGPVLAQLAGVQAECARLLAAGRRDAEELRERGREQAAALVADARARAGAERAGAAALARSAAETESAELLEETGRQVADLRARSAVRLPGYVGQVVDLVRAAGLDAPRPEDDRARRVRGRR